MPHILKGRKTYRLSVGKFLKTKQKQMKNRKKISATTILKGKFQNLDLLSPLLINTTVYRQWSKAGKETNGMHIRKKVQR